MMAPETEASPVGERRAIVHYHEHAFVVQFPISERETILISLMPETGSELLGFVETCWQTVSMSE